jgi:hypothetical protein
MTNVEGALVAPGRWLVRDDGERGAIKFRMIFIACLPSGVLRYVRPSGCFSIQSLATMLLISNLPAG